MDTERTVLTGVGTEAPSIESHQVNTMLFAFYKMQDLTKTERDKLYVKCYLKIATLPFEQPERWPKIYRDLQPTIRSIFNRAKVSGPSIGTQCTNEDYVCLSDSDGVDAVHGVQTFSWGVSSEILDLTVVVLDLIGSQPGDSYWPQVKAIKALRLSVGQEQDKGMAKIATALGVCGCECGNWNWY